MSDATSNDHLIRTARREGARRRNRYLPSARVVEELSGVSNLGALAAELRDCLTDAAPHASAGGPAAAAGHAAAAGQPQAARPLTGH